MSWDNYVKPPSNVCPEKYCFNWVPPGGAADVSGRSYSTFKAAISRRRGWKEFPNGGCACPFGLCSRIDPTPGSRDCYEPEEEVLRRDGLPWFYFVASVDQVAPEESKEEYLRESEKLWGRTDQGNGD